ncbi:MAG: hypothetical protein AAF810_16340, partial [Cyanobacteria bacterium P01_D01_bin.36]
MKYKNAFKSKQSKAKPYPTSASTSITSPASATVVSSFYLLPLAMDYIKGNKEKEETTVAVAGEGIVVEAGVGEGVALEC